METRYCTIVNQTDEPDEYGRKAYDQLISSGMAWEFHPWLTGSWAEDKTRFINEIYNTYANTED
jgi:hypothetical protein